MDGRRVVCDDDRGMALTTPATSSLHYRPEVDGLRAVAVIPVILYHAGFEWFSGGFVGVDVFFVISGYLITSLILSELAAGSFRLAHFYERRARRILPALFCVTTVTIPFAVMWLSPGDLAAFARSLVAVSLFSSNLLFWRESGYFDTAAELKPLIHTWSLAVEEQYYILFPLLLMLAFRAGRRTMLSLLGLIGVVSLGAAHWAAYAAPSAAFYLLPTRAWELLVGSFVAIGSRRQAGPETVPAVSQLASLSGLTMILVAILAFDEGTPFPSLYALLPVVGTAVVIRFAQPGTLVFRVLSSRVAVTIGLMSYSLYLWHQPLLTFAKHLVSLEPPAWLMASLAAATFPLSWLTWRFVETPFRRRTAFSRGQIFTLATAAAAASIATGAWIQGSSSLQERFQKQAYGGDVDHLEFNRFLEQRYTPCEPAHLAESALRWRGLTRCLQSKPGKDVDVALVGDSHAEHLFIGLAEQLKDRNVAYYIRDSLPVAANPEFEEIFAHVVSSRSIDTVIVAANWLSRVRQADDPATIAPALLRTMDLLVGSGKAVYLADDVPRFPFGPEKCKWVRWPFSGTTCVASSEIALRDRALYLPILEETHAASPALRRIELHRHLCDDGGCSMVRDGLLLFRDHDHLNIDGSVWMASKILADHPELREGGTP